MVEMRKGDDVVVVVVVVRMLFVVVVVTRREGREMGDALDGFGGKGGEDLRRVPKKAKGEQERNVKIVFVSRRDARTPRRRR